MKKEYEKKKKDLSSKVRGHESARRIAEHRKEHGRTKPMIDVISGGKVHNLDTAHFDFSHGEPRGKRDKDTGFHGSSLYPKKR